jgi:hypothetical protein
MLLALRFGGRLIEGTSRGFHIQAILSCDCLHQETR